MERARPTSLESSGSGSTLSSTLSCLTRVLPGQQAQAQAQAQAMQHVEGQRCAIAWRERIVAVYEEHNPSKLDSVDRLLASYTGREAELLRRIEEKYGIRRRVSIPAGDRAQPEALAVDPVRQPRSVPAGGSAAAAAEPCRGRGARRSSSRGKTALVNRCVLLLI